MMKNGFMVLVIVVIGIVAVSEFVRTAEGDCGGIKVSHVDPAAGEFADGQTIEVDQVNGLKVKDISSFYSPASYTGGESVTFPNGMIMKMGVLSDVSLNQTFYPVEFDEDFNSACVNVMATISMTASVSGNIVPLVKKGSVSAGGFEVCGDHSTNAGTGDIYWIAIGF